MALILLITIAVIAGIDVVIYIVLGAIKKHWEKKFKEDKDDENEIITTAKCCIVDNCVSCPLAGHGNCITDFMNHILEYMKTEPAPAATGTSSTKKENTFQIDDSTKSDICQVLASAMSTLLALRQEMEPHEKKAFDLGETYKDICCASAWMSSVRKGCDGNEH